MADILSKVFGFGDNYPAKLKDMGDGSWAKVVAIGQAIGQAFSVTGVPSKVGAGTLQRPANVTQYAIGDLIANDAVAANVTPIQVDIARVVGAAVVGRRLRLKIDDTGFKAAVIRVHLFRNQPAPTVGDNAVFNTAETYAVDEADYVGYADVTLAQQFSGGVVKGFATVDFISTTNPATSLFALLEARSVVTPGANSKTFTLALEALRD